MKACYFIQSENNFLYEQFIGDIGTADLQLIVEDQMKNEDFKQIRFVLSDIRKAKMVLNHNELVNYIADLKEQLNEMPLKWAMVANDPKQTAMSIIIRNDSFFKGKVEVFNTISAAIKFLSIPISEEDILIQNFSIVE